MEFIRVIIVLIGFASNIVSFQDDLIYGYNCRDNICHKIELDSNNWNVAISLPVCKLLCSDTLGTVWPRPTKVIRMGIYLVHVDENRVEFPILPKAADNEFFSVNQRRFTQILNNKILHRKRAIKSGGYPLKIILDLKNKLSEADGVPKLTLETDERYRLDVDVVDKIILAKIRAVSIHGARHGLETLSQIIVYDDIRRELQILANVSLFDAPTFKWRGILLDTSRNYYSLKAIKRTLDGMAMVKLNTFHWHITDSQSFPMEIKSRPELYKLGAYSSSAVYTHEDIAEVVEYGRLRGIRVMPEFDAPAHVGEGWQHTNMTVCFNSQLWKDFCVEPPCGQLDPTNEDLYSVLQDIYQEIFNLFNPDVFHMGGDEVSSKCWLTNPAITHWMSERKWQLNDIGVIRLWDYFQKKALERVDLINNKTVVPIILWTSSLTEEPFLTTHLDNKRYIIQIWTSGTDRKNHYILKNGFQVIISNHDALYFDCGASSWTDAGSNWCSPYIGWQKVYNNRIEDIAHEYIHQVLGAEATIWSEQIDESNLDQRLWPRASALAERLWSNPITSWRQAESRFLMHREHLVQNGIAAEALQPRWCLQHQNDCPIVKSSPPKVYNGNCSWNIDIMCFVVDHVFSIFYITVIIVLSLVIFLLRMQKRMQV